MGPEELGEKDPRLRQALSSLRYGLYFLSVGTPAAPQGMLVSWVSQVSGQPPLLLAAVRHNRSLAPMAEAQRRFALNLLPAQGQDLLARLARPAEQRFRGVALEEGPLGLPLLAEGLGALCCRVEEVWRPGDHLLLLGAVAGHLWRGGGPAMEAATGGHAYLGLS